MTPRTPGRNGGIANGAKLTTTIRIKNQEGKVVGEEEVVTYKGLLNLAHEEGLKRIETKILQIPSPENGQTVIVQAEVETRRGTFQAVGDANPGNVNRKIAPHTIRMAETRAKARALRDAVNIGTVALEELAGEIEETRRAEHPPLPQNPQRSAQGTGAGNQTVALTTPRAKIIPMPKQQATGRMTGQGAQGTGTTPQPPAQQTPEPQAPSAEDPNVVEEVPISENQRRFLFRLLSERGVTGEKAQAYLKEALVVQNLTKATKRTASALIDQLVKEKEALKAEEGVQG